MTTKKFSESLCFAKGCKNAGRFDTWHHPECLSCYCSAACFEGDVERHARLCRRIEGLNNVEIAPVDWIPDGIHPWTNQPYEHAGLRAKRKIYRGDIAIKEIPLVVDATPNPRADAGCDLGGPILRELIARARHDPSLPRSGDDFEWALVAINKDDRGTIETDLVARYVVKILLLDDPELVEKFLRSRFYHCSSRIRKNKSERMHHVREWVNTSPVLVMNPFYAYEANSFVVSSFGFVRMNHSCSPNVMVRVYSECVSYVALRDIEEGEELLICLNEHQDKSPTAAQRKREIRESLGFSCLCSSCEKGEYAAGSYNDIYGLMPDVIEANIDDDAVIFDKLYLVCKYLVREFERDCFSDEQFDRAKAYYQYERLRENKESFNAALCESQSMTRFERRKVLERMTQHELCACARILHDKLCTIENAILKNTLGRFPMTEDAIRERDEAIRCLEEVVMIGPKYDEARPGRTLIERSKNLKQTLITSPAIALSVYLLKLRREWFDRPDESPRDFAHRNADLLKKTMKILNAIQPRGMPASSFFARSISLNPMFKTLWVATRILETQTTK